MIKKLIAQIKDTIDVICIVKYGMTLEEMRKRKREYNSRKNINS